MTTDTAQRTSNAITIAAVIMASAGIASRLLGLLRDRLLASHFGAGDLLDAYYAAFRLPDTLFELLVLGALSAAFIPVFAGLLSTDRERDAWRMASGVLAGLAVVLTVAAVVAFVCAPALVALLMPGFDEAKTAMTVRFTRIMLLSPILMGASAVFGSVLMSLRRFAVYAFAPIAYNIGIITGILVLVPLMGPSGLAWGVVLGAALHFAVTMPSAVAAGFGQERLPLAFWRDPGVRKVMTLMVPRMFGTATQQLSMMGVTFFASLTAAGSLAAFSFANNVGGIPVGLVGVPFAVAAFPTLSAYAARQDTDAFAMLLVKYVRRTLFLVLPLAMLLIALRAQVVRVLFGAGMFDWDDTVVTFQILGILALSVFAQALIPLLARAFYAMHDTRTPVAVGVVSILVNVAVTVALLPRLDAYAIAWGFTAGAVVNFVALFVLLERALRHEALTRVHDAVLSVLAAVAAATAVAIGLAWLDGMAVTDLSQLQFVGISAVWLGLFAFIATLLRTDLFFVRLVSMTVLAAIAVQVVKYVVGTVTDLSTFSEVLVQLVAAGSVGAGAYLFLAHYFHIDEFMVLRARVLSMILRRNLDQGAPVDGTRV